MENKSNAEKFYNEILGFNLTNTSYPGARFFSAGGYHHHVGTNIWTLNKGIPKKINSTGMTLFTISIPDEQVIKIIEESAVNEGLLINSGSNELLIRDYDNNKVRVVS
ncbi:MAG: hypothetical protein H0W84_12630 [Bacteroidetes bacterium]|nr:hypothetical protein [Bacteroidota bacterium]